MPLLVHVLSTGDVHTVAQASGALRHLALCPENRLYILESGALEPLALAAQSEDMETLREVAACLAFLSLTDVLRLPIGENN
jgi:hypothetical protein